MIPDHCQAVPGASFLNAQNAFFWLLLPIMNSQRRIGSDNRKTHSMYMMMKAAPPYSPTIYGKRHMFPRPMADPAMAIRTPNRLVKFSLCMSSSFKADDSAGLFSYICNGFVVQSALIVVHQTAAAFNLPCLGADLREECVSIINYCMNPGNYQLVS